MMVHPVISTAVVTVAGAILLRKVVGRSKKRNTTTTVSTQMEKVCEDVKANGEPVSALDGQKMVEDEIENTSTIDVGAVVADDRNLQNAENGRNSMEMKASSVEIASGLPPLPPQRKITTGQSGGPTTGDSIGDSDTSGADTDRSTIEIRESRTKKNSKRAFKISALAPKSKNKSTTDAAPSTTQAEVKNRSEGDDATATISVLPNAKNAGSSINSQAKDGESKRVLETLSRPSLKQFKAKLKQSLTRISSEIGKNR